MQFYSSTQWACASPAIYAQPQSLVAKRRNDRDMQGSVLKWSMMPIRRVSLATGAVTSSFKFGAFAVGSAHLHDANQAYKYQLDTTAD
jgi:hypothetical protein